MVELMASRGRPRSFDRDEALHRAACAFWELGYEGATLEHLQKVMGGLTPPSLYAAFGSKERLFLEAAELHAKSEGQAGIRALTETPTARKAIEAMLFAAVNAYSQPGKPRGCLLVLGAVNCTKENRSVQEQLRPLRQRRDKLIRRRLERGVEDGDVAADVDVAALVSYLTAVLDGLALQARDGASRKSLRSSVACAMAVWDHLPRK
jgi:AcrR family transcriptional regulator